MEFSIKSAISDKSRSGCLVIAGYEKKKLAPISQKLPKSIQKELLSSYQRHDFSGEKDQTLLIPLNSEKICERVLLVGCGEQKPLSENEFRTAVRNAVTSLKPTGAKNALFSLSELDVEGRDHYWKVRQIVEISNDATYEYSETKSEKTSKATLLRKLDVLAVRKADATAAKTAIKEGQAISEGVKLARTLGNLPGNICTPTYLASQARALAKKHAALSVKVLEEKDMKRLGMGSLLSVTRGSRQPAKFIIMEYKKGKQNSRPHVLVGKGITFDSGGVSIKPSPAMDEMKYDMCGAASVLGTMSAVCTLGLPLNVVGIVPSCENMPDGDANKPGDIVTSMSGQTIEVLNTDAEGRLILCDALTYAEKYKPMAVIDIATLTGACVIALGAHPSGLLSNHQELADKVLAAGDYTRDRAWQLPLWEDYQEQLKSNFADMANIGGREAGTITAGCFLSRFTKKYHWAHLDIAGTAWKTGPEKGATGRPVPLLTQYLISQGSARKK